MESLLREILKQNSKISRIITKTAQQYPQTSSDLDLALYACIKIDKLLQKNIDNSSVPQKNQPSCSSHSSDPIFDAALSNIEAFKQATNKLDSKINVLIHESQHKGRYLERQIDRETLGAVCRKQSRKRAEHCSPKKKKDSPQRKKKDKALIEEQERDEPSKSLSEIDHSILKLTNQIVTMMHEGQKVRRHRKNSDEGQESFSMADGTDQ